DRECSRDSVARAVATVAGRSRGARGGRGVCGCPWAGRLPRADHGSGTRGHCRTGAPTTDRSGDRAARPIVHRLRLGGPPNGLMSVSTNRRWYRPMIARDVDQADRVSTPLELLFDLCFVVAVSQAAARLHHALSAGEPGHGVGRYLLVFFAIWWAWVNFT